MDWPVRLVQVAGGFVGQHDGRLADRGPGRWPPADVLPRTAGSAGIPVRRGQPHLARASAAEAPSLGEPTPA